MQSQFDLLTTEALELTFNEREAFVQLLLASLATDSDGDEELAAEVERRNADVDSEKSPAIPIAEALALVRAGLK